MLSTRSRSTIITTTENIISPGFPIALAISVPMNIPKRPPFSALTPPSKRAVIYLNVIVNVSVSINLTELRSVSIRNIISINTADLPEICAALSRNRSAPYTIR